MAARRDQENTDTRLTDPRHRRATRAAPRLQRLQLCRHGIRAGDQQGQPPLPLRGQGRSRRGPSSAMPPASPRRWERSTGRRGRPRQARAYARSTPTSCARSGCACAGCSPPITTRCPQPMRMRSSASSTPTRPGLPTCSSMAGEGSLRLGESTRRGGANPRRRPGRGHAGRATVRRDAAVRIRGDPAAARHSQREPARRCPRPGVVNQGYGPDHNPGFSQ